MRSHGYRRGTRKMFAKKFKEHGMTHTSRIMQQFKVGDMVDCVVDPSVVKGMPHKTLHGKTGVVFNCNPRSYGVIFNRKVSGKYIERQVHIRVEHLRKSRSTEDSYRRYAEYRKLLADARAQGVKISAPKRMPEGPMPAFSIKKEGNAAIELSVKPAVSIY
ncbi:large subunit ribosomal protein L21e [Enteropsectra breve]|nr:large subunit ribosomal protein L21e [Enteropsectra breve]